MQIQFLIDYGIPSLKIPIGEKFRNDYATLKSTDFGQNFKMTLVSLIVIKPDLSAL